MCKHLPIFGKVYTGYYSLLSRKIMDFFGLPLDYSAVVYCPYFAYISANL